MKNFVKLINPLAATTHSIYVVKLADNGQTIFNGSRGASLEQCNDLVNTYVLFESIPQENGVNRLISIANKTNVAISMPPRSMTIAVQYYVSITNETHFCTKCGKLLTESQAREHDCKSLCPICGATLVKGKCLCCLRQRTRVVNSYHSTPADLSTPIFSSPDLRSKKLHLGLEFEFATDRDRGLKSSMAKEIDLILNDNLIVNPDVRFEDDMTLAGDGFEVISHPQTLRVWRQKADKWQRFVDYLKDNHGTMVKCGSHIHVDRNFFGSFDDSRLAALYIGSYVAKHWNTLFIKIAGGNINEWSAPIAYNGKSLLLYAIKFNGAAIGHRTAINMGNSGTIEFRFWRGCLDFNQTLAYLDITQALCMWAKSRNDSNFVKSKPADLFKFCQSPSNTWNYIKRCITDTQLLADIRAAIDVCDGTDY